MSAWHVDLVRAEGLEPPRLSSPGPKPGASTSSATPAPMGGGGRSPTPEAPLYSIADSARTGQNLVSPKTATSAAPKAARCRKWRSSSAPCWELLEIFGIRGRRRESAGGQREAPNAWSGGVRWSSPPLNRRRPNRSGRSRRRVRQRTAAPAPACNPSTRTGRTVRW